MGGVSEIIRDGIDGFLVDPGICDELKEKITYLKDNETVRTNMSKAALERANDFDIFKKTREIEDLYQTILQSKSM